MSGDSSPSLPHALDADRFEFVGRAGSQSYYAAGEGAPLLLFHSINAAGSAYEVRPIFDEFRRTRRVFALDLPGFGFSDRSDRDYSVRLYTDAIHDMLDETRTEGPVDAVALSLSSEFLARAATEKPDRFRRLAFITPTGFRGNSDRLREPAGSTMEMRWLYRAVTVPVWSKSLYGLLVKPRVIRYFLKRTWGSDDYDADLATYDEMTTSQPGAEHAPFAFLSGRLFSSDIRDVYERLTMPVWLPHGTRGDFKDFRGARWAHEHDNWTVQAFDSGALPHFERPAEFFSSARAFLEASP